MARRDRRAWHTLVVMALLGVAPISGQATTHRLFRPAPAPDLLAASKAAAPPLARLALSAGALDEVEGAIAQRGAARVRLPTPGGERVFELRDAEVLPPGLQARFPHLRAWRGLEITPTGAPLSVRLERLSDSGLRAQFTRRGSEAVERFDLLPSTGSVFELRRHAATGSGGGAPRRCLADHDAFTPHWPSSRPGIGASALEAGAVAASASVRRRDYRLAMAATGEYTRFHGGTVAAGLAAVVTVVNRLNEIFETELAVHFELVENNDRLIFTNPSTDPYTGDDPGEMIDENQSVVDTEIGPANYDLGHVVSSSGGGLAFIGAVCAAGFKAGGVTGLDPPTGDFFVVDFVAHELGHQFGARHTFNGTTGSCNGQRDSQAAWEPGSGSTIMSYAGICGSENLQSQVDPYFHIGSIEEMLGYASTFGTCSANRNVANQTPVVTVPTASVVIPKQTPFRLRGSATDAANQTLSYSWEQFDVGRESPPSTDDGTRPLFRSFAPQSSGTRTLPKSENVFSGKSELGEVLPTRSRELNFRLTVRDNARFTGLTSEPYRLRVAASAGPFRVTQPAAGSVWSGATETVVWDVAGTDAAPVSCGNVDLLLYPNTASTPLVLLAGTANDGTENVAVPPAIETSAARIEVSCSNGSFFAVNPGAFSVTRPAQCGVAPSDLCLQSERFVARTAWRTSQGTSGQGSSLPLTSDTGAFSFFDAANLEVVVKVLDACAINGHYWVFAAGLTDVEVQLVVSDQTTGETATYMNPLGSPFQPVQDIVALSCAP